VKKRKNKARILFIVLVLLGIWIYFAPYLRTFVQKPATPTIESIKNINRKPVTVTLKNAESYEVRGIDVSRHQGNIDWNKIAEENIHFAYIKATEGTTYTDKNFDKNFTNAQKTNIKVGAYHFLSYDSSGPSQAENFIAKVPKLPGMLPPMIDIEFDPATVLPTQEVSDQIIAELIGIIEEFYGAKPVLYVNYDSYEMFVRGKYQDYPIWICDINKPAEMPEDQKVTLWQYSHTGRLQGVNKGNSNVDLNIFTGSMDEFLNNFTTN
jgi:lysozyme